jgi:hypothetical protein
MVNLPAALHAYPLVNSFFCVTMDKTSQLFTIQGSDCSQENLTLKEQMIVNFMLRKR